MPKPAENRTAPAHVLRPSVTKTPKLEAAVDLFKRREADLNARLSQGHTPPPTITNASTTRNYAGEELKSCTGRPGASHALSLPSRFGNHLRYPDGRVTGLDGTPVPLLNQ